MSDAPERIWIQSDHIPDELALNEWDTRPDDNEVHLFTEYVRADRIKELEEKLAKAEWLLVDASVQLEEGKIKTRRNRAVLIRQFLAEPTGGKNG